MRRPTLPESAGVLMYRSPLREYADPFMKFSHAVCSISTWRPCLASIKLPASMLELFGILLDNSSVQVTPPAEYAASAVSQTQHLR